MPRNLEAMKDVYNCDKLWRAVKSKDPKISEWGNPAQSVISTREANLMN